MYCGKGTTLVLKENMCWGAGVVIRKPYRILAVSANLNCRFALVDGSVVLLWFPALFLMQLYNCDVNKLCYKRSKALSLYACEWSVWKWTLILAWSLVYDGICMTGLRRLKKFSVAIGDHARDHDLCRTNDSVHRNSCVLMSQWWDRQMAPVICEDELNDYWNWKKKKE